MVDIPWLAQKMKRPSLMTFNVISQLVTKVEAKDEPLLPVFLVYGQKHLQAGTSLYSFKGFGDSAWTSDNLRTYQKLISGKALIDV